MTVSSEWPWFVAATLRPMSNSLAFFLKALPAVLVYALVASSAYAQSALEAEAPLALEQALQLAITNNPLLNAARLEIEAAEAQVLQGGLRPNPELGYLVEDAGHPAKATTAQLAWLLETGDKRAARVQAAERGTLVAVSEQRARLLKLKANVAAAFFDVLAAQELRSLAEDSVALAGRASDIAAKRIAAGKVPPVELTRAQVAEAGTRVALSQADAELRIARTRLSSLWGNLQPRFLQAEGTINPIPVVPTRAAVERRLAGAPIVERAERELERRRALVGVEQSRTVPDWTVSVGMKRREDTQGQQMLAGVVVPLPVFNRNQGNLLEALRREDKAGEELLATRLVLASEALQILDRVGARGQEAELLRKEVLPGARNAYEIATIGFENGKFSFLEVLDAQRTLFAAKSQYLNALSALHRALGELDALLGQTDPTPSPSSLSRNPE